MFKILNNIKRKSCLSVLNFHFSRKEILNYNKPDPKQKKRETHIIMQKSPTNILVIHPVFYPKYKYNKNII